MCCPTDPNHDMRLAEEVISKIFTDTITSMPVVMRMRYFYNVIAAEQTDSKIDYQKVRDLLSTNASPYDFNITNGIDSLENLANALFNAHCASLGVGPWKVIKCADCGHEFYMELGEVEFFQKKGFVLPKRCKSCRDQRKNQKIR